MRSNKKKCGFGYSKKTISKGPEFNKRKISVAVSRKSFDIFVQNVYTCV